MFLGVVGVLVFNRYYSLLDYQSNVEVEEWTDEFQEETEIEDQEDNSLLIELSEGEAEELKKDLLQNVANMEQEAAGLQTDCFNILLIGVDSRSDSFNGRSDAMILVSIDKKREKIIMTSLLRDMYVNIPGKGNNRLNAAYAYGGAGLLCDTIKANLGIEIDRCAIVNFYLVMDAIDALGGVEVEVTAEEIRVMNGYIREQSRLLGMDDNANQLSEANAGKMLLNGNQTLAYARVRYVGTDFARTGRQRKIVELCAEKAGALSLTQQDELLVNFLSRVRTDLTQKECASLLPILLYIDNYKFKTFTIPVEGSFKGMRIDGKSVLSVDFEKNAKAWYEFVNQDD